MNAKRDPAVVYEGGYVTFRRVKGGLSIEPTAEGREEAQELLEKRKSGRGPFGLSDMIEDALGNGWDMVPPEDIGALTEAEIISADGFIADDGTWTAHPDAVPCMVYAHMNYMVEDPIAMFAEGRSLFLFESPVELTDKGKTEARRKLKQATG